MPSSITVDFTANLARFSSSIDKATNDLNKFQSNASRVGKNVKNAFAGIAAGLGVAGITSGLISVNREFQTLKASLISVTGSRGAADDALSRIQTFAQETPFQLNEVVTAFKKLTALGLEPSMEALRSYGNTASAMGKSLDQFIEAIADAATGEFERLKEFGIKAKSQGDDVSFTFQGVTKTVRKSAEEIEGYLRDIGNVQFAGAMEEQMNTLDGAFSNLGDAVSRLAVTIGEAGLNDAIIDITNSLTKMINTISGAELSLDELSDEIIELEGNLDRLLNLEEKGGVLARIFGFGKADEIDKTTKKLEELRGALDKLQDKEASAAAAEAARKAAQETEKLAATSETASKKAVVAAKNATDELEKQREAFMRGLEGAANEIVGDVLEITDAMREAARVFSDTRTPAENLAIELEKLDALFESGNITLDTYSRAVFNAQESFESMTEETKSKSEELDDTWKSLGLTFSSAFEDAIVEGAKFRDLLGGLEKDILRIFTRKLVTEPLSNAISGLAGNLFGGFSLPAAANGADFMVGGSGNADSRLVAFMATPGERVTVTPKGVSTGSTINITVNNSGGSGNSASDSQLAAKIGQAVNRAMRRNT